METALTTKRTATESDWYKTPIQEILKEFSVNPDQGIVTDELNLRKMKYGANVLPQGKKLHWWQLFLGQFKNPLIFILLIAAGLTLWIEEYADFIVISLAILVNVCIGFWQEFRSSQIFEKLNQLVEVTARVIRNGKIYEIDKSELVPGDIILLRGDMKVPADARLLSAKDIAVEEALLTGESEPVTKNTDEIKDDKPIGDRHNMVYMGTIVDRGEGKAVVVATGANTEIGTIASLTASVEDETTPLQERLSRLGKKISIAVSIFALIIFITGLLEQKELVEIFTVAVAVAVAAIPEGLPAALSVILAISAARILRRRGLVKRLIGAETLGSTSVIVTDKTGTLTEGTMEVIKLICASDVKKASQALALSSNIAFVNNEKGEQEMRGEATDRAKAEYFIAQGGKFETLRKQYANAAFIPFQQTEKYIASFETMKNGQALLSISGAPEMLLKMSRIDKRKKDKILKEVEEHAAQGYRMIAAGKKILPKGKKLPIENQEALKKLITSISFLGVAAIRDPIRDDVKEAMGITREAGIRVIMATGDHKLTALAIGRDLGFNTDESAILNGEELTNMSDQELAERIKNVEIFSRVSPGIKMRVTETLRKQGEVVAMTGDGVNDAPALKASDIGISLGSGTDITKEAADLVLLDNSFSIITAAIQEGRIAFDNMRKVTIFLLSNSFTEIVIIMIGLIARTTFLPVTAVQILWANLVEDTFPNFALAFEPGEEGIMKRKPNRRDEQIIDKQGMAIIFIIGLLSDLMLGAIFLYLYFKTEFTQAHIQTIIFAILAINSLFIMFAIKSYHRSIFHTKLTDNRFLILALIVGLALMAAAVYTPPFQKLLGTIPLTPLEVAFVLGITIVQVALIEGVKWWFRRQGHFGFAKHSAV